MSVLVARNAAPLIHYRIKNEASELQRELASYRKKLLNDRDVFYELRDQFNESPTSKHTDVEIQSRRVYYRTLENL